jgi:hypothetical protein
LGFDKPTSQMRQASAVPLPLRLSTSIALRGPDQPDRRVPVDALQDIPKELVCGRPLLPGVIFGRLKARCLQEAQLFQCALCVNGRFFKPTHTRNSSLNGSI